MSPQHQKGVISLCFYCAPFKRTGNSEISDVGLQCVQDNWELGNLRRWISVRSRQLGTQKKNKLQLGKFVLNGPPEFQVGNSGIILKLRLLQPEDHCHDLISFYYEFPVVLKAPLLCRYCHQ